MNPKFLARKASRPSKAACHTGRNRAMFDGEFSSSAQSRAGSGALRYTR